MRPKGLLVIFLVSSWAVLGIVCGPSSGEVLAVSFFGSEAEGWGFSSGTAGIPGPSIPIFAGDSLVLGLFSTDGKSHNFGVDYNGNGKPDEAEPVSPDFSTALVYEINSTASPGTYGYFCYLHPDTMYGTLEILETSPTKIVVSPKETEIELGGSFRVVVEASGVQDLYGYRAGVNFDPTILNVRNVSIEGTWMSEERRPFAPSAIEFNNSDGKAQVEVWVQGTLPGVTGSGVLVFLDFEAVGSGRSTVSLEDSNTILWDSQMRPVPRELTDGSVAVLTSRLIDLWKHRSTVRLASDGVVTIFGAVRNAGGLPVYAEVQLSLTSSRTGKDSTSVAGPFLLSPGELHEWSATLAVPAISDRITVEGSILFSGRLLPEGDPSWLMGDSGYVSFRTFGDK